MAADGLYASLWKKQQEAEEARAKLARMLEEEGQKTKPPGSFE